MLKTVLTNGASIGVYISLGWMMGPKTSAQLDDQAILRQMLKDLA